MTFNQLHQTVLKYLKDTGEDSFYHKESSTIFNSNGKYIRTGNGTNPAKGPAIFKSEYMPYVAKDGTKHMIEKGYTNKSLGKHILDKDGREMVDDRETPLNQVNKYATGNDKLTGQHFNPDLLPPEVINYLDSELDCSIREEFTGTKPIRGAELGKDWDNNMEKALNDIDSFEREVNENIQDNPFDLDIGKDNTLDTIKV